MLRDETDLTRRPIYIGRTLFVDRRGKINRIEPLAQATDRGWQPIEQRDKVFPSEGKVFTFDHSLVGKEDYILLFTVHDNQRDGGLDRFIIDEWCEPYEVLKWFEQTPAEEQRTLITRKGVHRGKQLLTRVILPVRPGVCAFPEIREDDVERGWTLSPQEQDDRIETYELPLDQFGANLEVMGRYFALPGRKPNKLIGALNWQSDPECIEAICKALKKADGLVTGELAEVSQAVLRRLTAAYQNGDLLAGDGRLAALNERLGFLLPKLKSAMTYVDEIADQLSASPEVSRRIEVFVHQEKEKRLNGLENQLRSEFAGRIEADFNEEKSRLDDLRRESISLREGKAAIEAEIAKLREDRDTVSEELRGALTGALEELRRSGDGVRRLLDVARDHGLAAGPLAAPAILSGMIPAPWTISTARGDAGLITLNELPGHLQSAAKKNGLDPKGIASLDILARAGEFPVLEGDAADMMISAYAGCVAAGAVYRMPIDPTILGVADLWSDAQRGCETPLTAAWRTALAEPDTCHIVVLERVDAANLANWVPLFREYFRRERPANLIALATRSAAAAGYDAQRDKEFVVRAPGSVKAAAAFLIAGARDTRTTMLIGGLLDELDENEAQTLAGICVDHGENALRIAVRLKGLARAAKCWTEADEKLASLPYEMLEINRDTEVA